ncbi:MAG: dimethylsulfoniopropionate demethylase [Pseudomonadota bacterium]
MTQPLLVLSRRLRETPFEKRVFEQGAQAFTIYNHTPLSAVYRSPEEDYSHLCEHVQLWDVSCERQVEVAGPDALQLVELITPRDISTSAIGQCKYAPLTDEHGGIVNDPIILRLAEDRFWISIADSDVLLWVKGLAAGRAMDVQVFEPDVSPLAVQGPKADDLMAEIVGEHVRDIRFFWFIETEIASTPVILARSGWSGQGGFEIYLQDSGKGLDLWDAIWQVGEKYQIRAGCPNLIERLETGLLSYGSDMTLANNPFECGLDRFCDFGKPAEYLARQALKEIKRDGVARKIVRLRVDGRRVPAPRGIWSVVSDTGDSVGMVTSLAWSPRFDATLCLAIVDIGSTGPGTNLTIEAGDDRVTATVATPNWK